MSEWIYFVVVMVQSTLHRSVFARNQYCPFAYKPKGAGAVLSTSTLKICSGQSLCILYKWVFQKMVWSV